MVGIFLLAIVLIVIILIVVGVLNLVGGDSQPQCGPDEIYRIIEKEWKRWNGGRINYGDFVTIGTRFTDWKLSVSGRILDIECSPDFLSRILDCFEKNGYQVRPAGLKDTFFVTRRGPAV